MATEEGAAQAAATPRIVYDLDALATTREAEWLWRQSRVERDGDLLPGEAESILDRTLIGTQELAALMNVGRHRVTMGRDTRNTDIPQPHPSLVPTTVALGDKVVAGRRDPLVEKGAAVLRLLQSGRCSWDPVGRGLRYRPQQRPGAKLIMGTYGQPKKGQASARKRKPA